MPVIGGIIAVILALVALYIVLLAIAMLILPAAAAAFAFFASISFWVDQRLASDQSFRRSLAPRITETSITWELISSHGLSLWPTLPLFAATGAALLVVLLEVPFVQPKFSSSDSFFYYSATVVAFGAAAGAPILTALAAKDRMHAYLTQQIVDQVGSKLRGEASLVQEIASTEEQLADHYEAIGVDARGSSTEDSRDFLIQCASGGGEETRTRLCDRLAALNAELTILRTQLERLEDVKGKFQQARASVIYNGSAALLDALDRLHLGLHSDLLTQLFADQKWPELDEVLDGMSRELELIQGTAERKGERGDSNDKTLAAPQSLEDAYRILNVNANTRKDVIKSLFRALQKSWHPDLVSDKDERRMRNAKVQQINSAWDLIEREHTDR